MRFTIALFFIIATLAIPTTIIQAQAATVSTGGTIDERLNAAVAKQGLVLDPVVRATIQSQCKNSQQILADMQQRTESIIRKRIDVYGGLQKDLIAIQLRMVRQGSDASEIDLLTGKIQQGLDEFTLVADAYGTGLNDVVTVNCIDRPEQFQAGLLMMRAQRAQLLKTATGLKNIMLSAPLTTYEPLKKRMQF